MKRFLILLGAIPIMTVAAAPDCEYTSSPYTFQVGSGDRSFYIIVEAIDCGTACGVAWLYQELNLREGLQRSDWVRDDVCGNSWAADWNII